jgi:phospholipid transport system substrate-binding protein
MPTTHSGARFRAALVVLAAAALLQGGAPALAQEAPDVMVKRVAQDVLATIKADPLIQAGNEARIRDVLEAKLLPNFDFMRMTALAMGKNWRAATPEQQKRLADEFRALLVRT